MLIISKECKKKYKIKSNNMSFYSINKDTRDSTSTLVNENLEGVTAYKYDEFGITETLGTDIGNEVCYTGGINDRETGHLYLNARYYNPKDGRFVTLDTYRGEFEDRNAWHLYTYCVNNPINYVDPSGHYAASASLAGGVTITLSVGHVVAFIAVSGVIYNSIAKYYKWPRIEYHHPYHRWSGYSTMVKQWKQLKGTRKRKIKWFMRNHAKRPHIHFYYSKGGSKVL